MLLNMERVCKTYGDRTLLDHVTFYMKQGDRVGVVGVNGCGKSTFLRLAAGREKPDSGAVSYDPNVRLGYLPQDPPFDPENTVMEQVEAGLDKTAREVARYEAVEILTRLGITDTQQKMGSLSGGQRKRVALAACLVHPADLLLLDEPTNHLDAEMIGWLENYLQRFTGGILLVTHDRYFLERVADRTLEVSFGRVYIYEGATPPIWTGEPAGRRWMGPRSGSGSRFSAGGSNGCCKAPAPGAPKAGNGWNGMRP